MLAVLQTAQGHSDGMGRESSGGGGDGEVVVVVGAMLLTCESRSGETATYYTDRTRVEAIGGTQQSAS